MNNVVKRKILAFIIVVFFTIVLENIYDYFFESNLIISALIFMMIASITYGLIIYKKL
ncbi:hypothetical protein [Senegalia massiliensis]|uniref:hypothetical protein n=1 Tax=Senegalia massiliensis TaxID=1720316 RepID=UPI0013630E2F|nr:hypothetical protein [Senegalia massiliensis]